MLSNRYISENIPSELWDLYSEMGIDLILAYAVVTASLEVLDYLEYARVSAELRERAALIGAATWPKAQSALSKVMREAAEKHLESDEKLYTRAAKAGLLNEAPPLAESALMNGILQQNYRKATNQLYQIHTMALNIPLEALENAYFAVQSGSVTLQDAIKTTVSDLAERGISVAKFPSGRALELSSYVRMIVRTSVSQNAAELGFKRMEEWGCDLLHISAHAGARPLCFPYQGRIFSLSGDPESKYPPFSSTSFGEPAGILGINCGHHISPWIEGLDRVPTAEERDPAKHDLGKSNAEVYAESQRQRYNERKIREWKRRADAMEAAGLDPKMAQAKVREWQGRQRQLIQESGRTRRPDREQIMPRAA
jgi:hypothetical protein